MITYKTNRPNIKKYLLFQLLGIICVFLVLMTGEYTFSQFRFFKNINYFVIGAVALVPMFIEIMRERICEIGFDDEKQRMSFSYKTSVFSKLKKYELPYDIARVERGEDTAFIKWLTPPSLYFFKGKLELFQISKQKDGFSNKILDEIYNTCVQICNKATS